MSDATKRSLFDLRFVDLQDELANYGISPTHARALWRALYVETGTNIGCREDFLPPLARWLGQSRFCVAEPVVEKRVCSSDGRTRKFLLRLADGNMIETVIMGYPGRFTACLSTQVGCAMGCVFCATGQMGFRRHLQPGEIVAQALLCHRELKSVDERGLRNIVLMGMGEPLHNYDSVMTALEIISDTGGINVGPARISVSTVGVVPGILRLAEEGRPYNLAVSLHGATEEQRASLVPVSKRWPLSELIAACRIYVATTGRRIFFEWTLIDGVNDSVAQAEKLAELLQGIEAHINLIPLNPTVDFGGGATRESAAGTFQKVLRDAGFPSTVRQRRGIDVGAGCGQLCAAEDG